jgi:CDP-diacylglycerol pyrophosphatase
VWPKGLFISDARRVDEAASGSVDAALRPMGDGRAALRDLRGDSICGSSGRPDDPLADRARSMRRRSKGQRRGGPCAFVDISSGEDNGVAILKDINGVAQHLAIPTRRIGGIESAEILDSALPNYWRAAWAARRYLELRLSRELPRDAVGLAINAANRRSQDQFHIHIDCVAPGVRDALAGYRVNLNGDWHVLPFSLNGRRYWARRLDSIDLSDTRPFSLLADGVAGAKGDMAEETLVVIGATFASAVPGFILLADHADPNGGGHGEDLLDSHCSVAGKT